MDLAEDIALGDDRVAREVEGGGDREVRRRVRLLERTDARGGEGIAAMPVLTNKR